MSYGSGDATHAEVNALEGKVGGDQNFVTEWDAQDGSVIPDPSGTRATPRLPESWRIRELATFPRWASLTSLYGHHLGAQHWPNSSRVALRPVEQRLRTLELQYFRKGPMDSCRLTSRKLLCYGLVVNLL